MRNTKFSESKKFTIIKLQEYVPSRLTTRKLVGQVCVCVHAYPIHDGHGSFNHLSISAKK